MDEEQDLRPLTVDLEDLELAFDSGGYQATYFLDTATGDVLRLPDEAFRVLERLYEEIEDEDPSEDDLSRALSEHEPMVCEEEDLLLAHKIESDVDERYLRVEADDSSEGYRDMEEFAATVTDQRLRDRMEMALDGRGAFRRFKNVLATSTEERERWFAFKSARLRERIVEWLHAEGIEPIHERRLPS